MEDVNIKLIYLNYYILTPAKSVGHSDYDTADQDQQPGQEQNIPAQEILRS